MALGINKRMKRREKKKRKMVAYLAVAKLNDEDREHREAKQGKRKVESPSSGVQGNEDAFCHKKTREDDMEIVTESSGDSPKKSNKLGNFSNNTAGTGGDRSDVAGGSSAVPGNHNNSDDQMTLDELRKAAWERKRKFQVPTFRLKECGESASLNIPEEQRIPFFMVDVQHLIMWSLLGHHAPFQPSRMYQLSKYNKLSHTVLLMVDGICLDDLKSAHGILHLPSPPMDDGVTPSSPDTRSTNIFPWRVELLGPSVYGSTLVQDMATVPLSNTQYLKVIKKYGSLERAIKGKAIYKVFRGMFPIKNWESFDEEEESCEDGSEEGKDRFPRTRLLISADQMIQMGYPLPLVKKPSHPEGDKQPVMIPNEMHLEKQMNSVGRFIQSPEFLKNLGDNQPSETTCSGNDSLNQNDNEDADPEEEMYVFSRPWYEEVGPNSPMFSLDCEMCLTGRQRSELTRIAIVNEELQVVYESLVKPRRKITNYLTRFSGITESMLKDVNTRLSDVQRDLRELLPPDAILVGQSLNFDLHALKMMHPYVIDTSIAFNLSGELRRRTKLATLAQLFLSETIQCHGSKGHNPIEDASAAMKLILLKLSKSISYGDASLRGQAKMREKVQLLKDRSAECLKEHEGEVYGTSIFSHVKRGKHAAVVLGINDVIREYEKYAVDANKKGLSLEDKPPKLISVENSSEAVSRACEVMLDHQLCIVHLSSQSVGENLSTLEEWCLKIVDHCAPNSMCIVVLGGAKKTNGACLIHLKGSE